MADASYQLIAGAAPAGRCGSLHRYCAGLLLFVTGLGIGMSFAGRTGLAPTIPTLSFVVDGGPALEEFPVEASAVLPWLRAQDFNKATEAHLLEHPLVKAAESRTMPLEAVKLMLLEEYSIESSDLRSMAAALARFGDLPASRSFFQASADGEAEALTDLVAMASSLGISEQELRAYEPMPEAHAYSAYLAQLSQYSSAANIAAGFAVNFPTWGRMCGRIRDALLASPYNMSTEQVAFLSYFAAPMPGFDASAEAVIAEHMRGLPAEPFAREIRTAVRLLQAYEIMFWDTIWAKAQRGGEVAL